MEVNEMIPQIIDDDEEIIPPIYFIGPDNTAINNWEMQLNRLSGSIPNFDNVNRLVIPQDSSPMEISWSTPSHQSEDEYFINFDGHNISQKALFIDGPKKGEFQVVTKNDLKYSLDVFQLKEPDFSCPVVGDEGKVLKKESTYIIDENGEEIEYVNWEMKDQPVVKEKPEVEIITYRFKEYLVNGIKVYIGYCKLESVQDEEEVFRFINENNDTIPDHQYTTSFSIREFNSEGVGPWSEPVEFDPVTNPITIEDLTSDEYEVRVTSNMT